SSKPPFAYQHYHDSVKVGPRAPTTLVQMQRIYASDPYDAKLRSTMGVGTPCRRRAGMNGTETVHLIMKRRKGISALLLAVAVSAVFGTAVAPAGPGGGRGNGSGGNGQSASSGQSVSSGPSSQGSGDSGSTRGGGGSGGSGGSGGQGGNPSGGQGG